MQALTPADFGLSHNDFRPHQEATIEWALNAQPVKILEAPTGSGKTAVARAIASARRVVSLVRTKVLQQENYERAYGFDVLYGRGNYECVYRDAKPGTMADHCVFAEEGMTNCPDYGRCPYIRAREKARTSEMASLNYAYWLHVFQKWTAPDVLVCDEAHELSAITLEWAGITINNRTRKEFDLPVFPVMRTGGGTSLFAKSEPLEERAYEWLNAAREKLLNLYSHYSSYAETDEKARKAARRIELLGKKVRATMDALQLAPKDWYIRSGPGVLPASDDGTMGFVARPLTAKHHFKSYFAAGWELLCMSATIGSLETFTDELGLSDVDFYSVPSNWPAPTRPIEILDVPRLGKASTDRDWDKQATEIAKAVQSVDPSWSGIIHVTSIAEASRLANRLAQKGLQDRVHVSPRLSTERIVADWHSRRYRVPNSLLVTWALWEGYDGTQEKISIAAKVPYPYLGDPYEVERRNYNAKYWNQRAANQLEQGLGRTRRGNAEDYDTPEEKRGLVAIADGSWKWVRNYFSKSFSEAILSAS